MNSVITFFNSTGKTFIDFSAPMLIQSTVLIIILLAADLLLRKKVRALFRYCIWMLVLVKLVLPATLSAPTGLGSWLGDELDLSKAQIAKPVEQTAPGPEKIMYEIPAQTALSKKTDASGNSITSAEWPRQFAEAEFIPIPANNITLPAAPTATVSLSWQGVAFLGWLAAVIAMTLLLVQRMFFVKGLIAQSKDSTGQIVDIFQQCCQQLQVRRRIALKLSPIAASPSVCGLFRPTILIPHDLPGKLKPEDITSILLHELAHIKRADLQVSMLQTILQIAYFYNPLLWLANAIIRNVREQAVDEMVLVALGTSADDYPETLLNISRLTFSRPVLSLRLIGVVESKKALSARIKHILSRPFPKSAKLGIAGLTAIIIAASILLPMAKAAKDSAPDTNTGPLSIRLLGVRPDAGVNIYDPKGQKTNLKIDPTLSPQHWGEGKMAREFIFNLPETDQPILFEHFVRFHSSDDQRGFSSSQNTQTVSNNGKKLLLSSLTFNRTYRKNFLAFFTRNKEVKEIDLTLGYYYGPRRQSLFSFTGPFISGKKVQADGKLPYTLTPKEDRQDGALFHLFTKEPFEEHSTPAVAYDFSGKRYLVDGAGGSSGSSGVSKDFLVRGASLGEIAAIAFGEKPFEAVFRNIVVNYPDLPAKDHAEYLDAMASRLGLTGLKPDKLVQYQFKDPQEAIEVIDIVRGIWHIRKVFETIQYAMPKIKLSELDKKTSEKIHNTAKKWTDSTDLQIRAFGICLGLFGQWPQFSDMAIDMLKTDYGDLDDRDYSQTQINGSIREVARSLAV